MNYQNSQSYIYNALLKYGYSNFSLTIIEYCDKEKCIQREKYYINFFESEYNTVKDPTLPPMAGRTHSPETKQILSDGKKGENHPNYGQTLNNKTKKKISDTKKGQPKIEGSGSPSQQIEVFDIKNNTTTSYDSMGEAARALNLPNYTIISNYILRNQKKPYKGKYTFKKKV